MKSDDGTWFQFIEKAVFQKDFNSFSFDLLVFPMDLYDRMHLTNDQNLSFSYELF